VADAMNQMATNQQDQAQRQCPNCNAPVRRSGQFCSSCGTKLSPVESVRRKEERPRVQVLLLPLLLVALGISIYAAVAGHLDLSRERSGRHSDVARLEDDLLRMRHSLETLMAQNATLVARVRKLSKDVATANGGFAPIARMVLRSVFTVETTGELGTAWAAWTDAGSTYLMTANHVIADAQYTGSAVTVRQKNRTWTGTIATSDSVNDLAVVRVAGLLAPPLWQTPRADISPLAGDELLLLGSPYGLEGTVTTGVVSRVTYDTIQTDAAANPGNSGGPAVDREGNVVGVLVAGGAENLNFAVPIQRACVTVRKC
jgi:S1-C subfamily serine protease